MRKHSAQDDKKLQSILKKLQVTPVTGVEEVNLFKDDGTIIHFPSPKGVDIKDLVLQFYFIYHIKLFHYGSASV